VRGDLATAVAELKGKPGREVQIHGSGAMAHTLMERGLIDEYRFVTAPVVLSKGKRLFVDGARPAAMAHTHRGVTSTGVSLEAFSVAGEPTFGTFGPEYDV